MYKFLIYFVSNFSDWSQILFFSKLSKKLAKIHGCLPTSVDWQLTLLLVQNIWFSGLPVCYHLFLTVVLKQNHESDPKYSVVRNLKYFKKCTYCIWIHHLILVVGNGIQNCVTGIISSLQVYNKSVPVFTPGVPVEGVEWDLCSLAQASWDRLDAKGVYILRQSIAVRWLS